MIKNLLKKTVSIILVLAMLLQTSSTLCYAAGESAGGDDEIEEVFLTDEELHAEDPVYDDETTELINSTNERDEA